MIPSLIVLSRKNILYPVGEVVKMVSPEIYKRWATSPRWSPSNLPE
jgi:hypothetical protein